MKILCKVNPDNNTCCGCIDDQWSGVIKKKSCKECLSRIPDYEILQLGHTFFGGDWAMVLNDEGKIERVKLSRVFDVRTEHIENAMSITNIHGHRWLWTGDV